MNKKLFVLTAALILVSGFSFAMENSAISQQSPGVFKPVVGIGLSVDDVEAAPVPWVPGEGNIRKGTLAQGILFKSVPQEAQIMIYTVSGELVKKIVVTNHIGGDYVSWDGKNNDGADVASGVYIWLAKSDEGKKSGKLIVIR